VSLLHKSHVDTCKVDEYAKSEDFCTLFTEDVTGLYLLSLLLTAKHEKAEECFVAGVENSVRGNPVFKEWARSWAKRMMVENAIRIIAPRPNNASPTALAVPLELNCAHQTVPDRDAVIASVLQLAVFERFVFVMSVLERYRDQDCSVLLGCSLQEIGDARTRALQQIAQSHGDTQPVKH